MAKEVKKSDVLDEVDDIPEKLRKKASQETKEEPKLDLSAVLNELAELRAKVAKMESARPAAAVVQPPKAAKTDENPDFLPLEKDAEVPAGAKVKKVRVKIPHCRSLDMEVVDIPGMGLACVKQAEDRYNKYFGIIKTEHKYEVMDL